MVLETSERAINPTLRSGIFGGRFIRADRSQPTWHGQGTTFQGAVKASEAVKLGEMDYGYALAPMTFQSPWGTVTSDRQAIIRQPVGEETEPTFLGYAGPNFHLFQNTEIAAILDPITEEMPVDCVFALNDGRATVFTLNAGEGQIAGEDYREFFVAVDGKDGGTAFSMMYTPVRAQCQNTTNLAIRQSILRFKVPHRQGANDRIDFYMKAMPAMRRAQVEVKEAIEALTTVKVDDSWMNDLLVATYPDPKLPAAARQLEDLGDAVQMLNSGMVAELQKSRERYEYAQERVKAVRDGARTLYEKFNDEFPNLAGTGYAFVNAVTESADWRRGSANAGVDALFGARAEEKARAYQAVMGLN